MQRDDLVRVRHMLDAAREAVALCAGRSRGELDTNRLLNLSLVRLLEIVGEAARSTSPEFRAEHAQIAWNKAAGMRDRLIHGYFDVNLDIVWGTVTEDLPPLIAQLEKVLAAGD